LALGDAELSVRELGRAAELEGAEEHLPDQHVHRADVEVASVVVPTAERSRRSPLRVLREEPLASPAHEVGRAVIARPGPLGGLRPQIAAPAIVEEAAENRGVGLEAGLL